MRSAEPDQTDRRWTRGSWAAVAFALSIITFNLAQFAALTRANRD